MVETALGPGPFAGVDPRDHHPRAGHPAVSDIPQTPAAAAAEGQEPRTGRGLAGSGLGILSDRKADCATRRRPAVERTARRLAGTRGRGPGDGRTARVVIGLAAAALPGSAVSR